MNTIDLDQHGAFTSAYQTLKNLMLTVMDWMMSVTIGGVPILYINLGFALMVALFALLLPILKSNGAAELTNSYAKSAAQDIRARQNRNAPRLRGGPNDKAYK